MCTIKLHNYDNNMSWWNYILFTKTLAQVTNDYEQQHKCVTTTTIMAAMEIASRKGKQQFSQTILDIDNTTILRTV